VALVDTVLYVGRSDEALDLADALAASLSGGMAVVSAQDAADVSSLVTDERLACLVCADPDAEACLDAIRNVRLDVPVIAYGVELNGDATVALDAEAEMDELAARVEAVLADVVDQFDSAADVSDGPDSDTAGVDEEESDAADADSTATADADSTTTADQSDDAELGRVHRGSDVYYAVDEDWRVTEWDPRMEARTGYAPEDAIGEPLWDLFPEAGDTDVSEAFGEVMESREPAVFELYYDPGDYWVRVRAYPTDDGGVEFFTRDISEEKERQRQLRATRERIADTLERIDDAFFAVDDEWRITYFNANAERVLGREAEDILGKSLWAGFPEARDSRFYDQYSRAMETQEPVTFEEYYEPLETWFEVRAYPSADGLSVYFRDVTDQREREAELRRKTRAIEAAPIGISISDPDRADNPLVYVNEAFERITGYDADDVLGQNCRFLQGDDTEPEQIAKIRAAIEAGEPVEVELLNYAADGTPFWNRVAIAPVYHDGDLVNFVGFQREVTSERQLRERLRALHETTGELMLATTPEAVGRLVVDAASDILGLPMTSLWAYREPENVVVAVAESDRLGDRLDRRQFPADETPAWDAFAADEVRVFDDLAPEDLPGMDVRSAIVAPVGDFGFLVTGSVEPDAFDDQDVELFRILATTTRSALYRAEREQELQRQNERLDEFVSVVSHDLRNPLQVATSRLDVYRTIPDEEHLDRVEASHERMELLIEDLLALARQGETVSDPEQVHLSPIIDRAWRSIEAPEATLEAPVATTLVADPDRLQQLFENLFRNAVEHAGPDMTVTVETTVDGFFVADDGPGIPPEDREAVFEHGFTTSEGGTGFGLSIVKRIAEAHDWTITVGASETGGARFTISGIHSITATG
jgi:PAS domain S-box-containing protein